MTGLRLQDFSGKLDRFISRDSGLITPGTFAELPGYMPGLRNEGQKMSENFIIEVNSQAAGIVVRNPGGYVFFAATHRFNSMEGQLFRNAREAERAALRLANGELPLAA